MRSLPFNLEGNLMRKQNRDLTKGPELPQGYRLDTSDPDFVFVLRQDGSRVAVFNAQSASAEHIQEAADEDFRRYLS